jgi:hypothetical protein
MNADLANYGEGKASRTVALVLDGRREEKTVELAPYARRTCAFETEVSKPGRHTCRVELSPDSLPDDDRRYLVLNLTEETSVLLVESQRVTGRFVNQALTADSAAGYKLTTVNAAELGRENLGNYRAVIITDPFALRTGDWNRLEFYLRSGGACLLTAGLAPVGPAGLGDYVQSSGMSRTAGFISVTAVDTASPALSRLDLQSFSSLHVWQHSRLDPKGSRVLARLGDGDPLMLEDPNQKLIIWSIGPTPELSDIVYKAVFVPLLVQTVGYLCQTAQKSEYVAGDTIRLQLERATPVLVTTPAGRTRMVPAVSRGRAELVLTDTRIPGIYAVEPQSDTGTVFAFAVNPRAEEGDLAQAKPDRLTNQGFRVRTAEPVATADLSLPFLYLAALAFCSEMLLLVLERGKAK